jgi:hypothetical protein
MCSAMTGAAASHGAGLSAVDAARVGVFAFVNRAGEPVSCAVTPFVDGDDAVVTSTLALLAKVKAVRADPRVALLAGNVEVRGPAAVEIDVAGREFDRVFRRQELAKYPPSRTLFRVPGHRRWLWWYAGRAIIRIGGPAPEPVDGDDRVTLTALDRHGTLRIVPIDLAPGDLGDNANRLAIPTGLESALPDGPACILVHEEDTRMADLRQLRLDGRLESGTFSVARRSGSLTPATTGQLGQLRQLRRLARAANANRPLIEQWEQESKRTGHR